ncbi:sperm-associated antigen 8 [Trichechus manatus latirostris]|uniref:Sperm-associated antigen 8 n=1 Tax=Trichechus manatus latirostris TaxID=127582 RepID=A0A2Y9QUY2_TRIMA|nr:sperm-associated antigen 8 [Trichechus manatus latirostris]
MVGREEQGRGTWTTSFSFRSLDVQRSSEALGSSSETLPSSEGVTRSALAAATAAAASAASAASAAAATAAASIAKAAALSTKITGPYSQPILLTDPSSDLSFLGYPYAGSSFTHKIGHGSLGFEPTYVSCVAQDPGTTTDSCPSYHPRGSSSGPVPDSSSSTRWDSGPGHGSGQGSGSGFGCGSGPGRGSGQGSGRGPGAGPGPSTAPGPKLRNPRADPVPTSTSWSQQCYLEPQKQPSWEFLQVPEPGARGLWKPSKVEGKSNLREISETLPRGQCLLYNWEEERATNHLDRVPSTQDGCESFFFRHGHRGLRTLQLQSPMPSSTTQKDSHQPPANLYPSLRGKREAMLEMLLHHQICKEVQAEQEPTRKLFETQSVTHHDYRMELVQSGPPAPTKPHDYRREQPETFWLQRAPQLPGVSNIKTLDTPFRRNCSFTTPVPLSLGQPLPYEPENYPHQLGEMSSLACQGEGSVVERG